jgi:hypothetical protein
VGKDGVLQMKLSIIAPDTTDACAIYRAHPWAKLGVETEFYSGKLGFQLWQAVISADVVLLQRPWTVQNVNIARTVKDAGKKLLLDYDDDLSCLPAWNPNAHHFKGCLPHLHTLCSLADAVTVATPALAQAAAAWGASRIAVVPNAIDDGMRGIVRHPRNPIMLWRGSGTHSADLEEGRAYLTEMNKTHEIVFMGDKPAWAYTLRHRHFGVTDYVNYLTTMATLAPDIVAIPLVDHPFNLAKSDVGAIEAALIGAKLWHNGVGEFRQHAVNEIPNIRWLSDVNYLRSEVLNSL